jgi:beta-glucanase (GH16 family)
VAVLCAAYAAACNDVPERGVPASPGDGWPGPGGRWSEVFRDDFEGPVGAPPDPNRWNVVVSANNPNNECERYTDSRDNSYLDGAGYLVIQALRQAGTATRAACPPSFTYTSARLDSRGQVEVMPGRVEARIKLPVGAGLWPAFWMLGTTGGRWPNNGEIDIMEERGSVPNVVVGSVHGPEYFGAGALSKMLELPVGTFADGFHLFAFEWSAEGMRWLVDEQVYHSRTRTGMAAMGDTWVFDQPFYILLNLAVGGNFGGNPTEATPFPSQMIVDYVRAAALATAP